MQKSTRDKEGTANKTIGFTVLKVRQVWKCFAWICIWTVLSYISLIGYIPWNHKQIFILTSKKGSRAWMLLFLYKKIVNQSQWWEYRTKLHMNLNMLQICLWVIDFILTWVFMYQVENNRRYRIHNLSLQEKVFSTVYRDSRSMFMRYGPVKKGRYVVVPSTFEPDQEASFLLRVYTSSANNFM